MAIAVGAVLLAAGASKRFGTANKLLADIAGEPLLRRVARQLAELAEIVVVTGHDADACITALAGVPARFAHNSDWQLGIGGSIGVGIKDLGGGLDGAFIVPGDLVFLTRGLIDSMVTAFVTCGGKRIVFPMTPEGGQRNPVLWPRRFFPDLELLPRGEGAKMLLQRYGGDTLRIKLNKTSDLKDIDTPADLDAARARLAAGWL